MNIKISPLSIQREDLSLLIKEYEDKILTRNKAEELLRILYRTKRFRNLITEAKTNAKSID
jgi:hypothetical protein